MLHFAYYEISEMLESHKRAAMYVWLPFFNSYRVENTKMRFKKKERALTDLA